MTWTARPPPGDRGVQSAGPPGRIRLAVVAEIRLYREGLAASIARRKNFMLVGVAASRTEALALVASGRPDVVVLDMASRNSLDFARSLRSGAPGVKVIAFGVEETDREILACAETGVAGYVPCQASVSDLVATIESVARGELLCSPRVAATLFRRVCSLATGGGPPAPHAVLTSREREIAVLLDRGLSNKDIARYLHIEVATVKNHVHSILEKLRVTSRGEAAARLRSEGASLASHEPTPAPLPAARL